MGITFDVTVLDVAPQATELKEARCLLVTPVCQCEETDEDNGICFARACLYVEVAAPSHISDMHHNTTAQVIFYTISLHIKGNRTASSSHIPVLAPHSLPNLCCTWVSSIFNHSPTKLFRADSLHCVAANAENKESPLFLARKIYVQIGLWLCYLLLWP